ncbi:MAG TPA: cell division protein ZapA [Acetobacteraceae bacterium]|nr:cell division protein ZapA [Acetobacteraceae bacterium]
MAQVTVRINGYAYTVGCEDGQEAHLQRMSEQVESRINSIKALGGQSGEARLLVLASLLMADELHDLNIEVNRLRAGMGSAMAGIAPVIASGPTPAELEALARLERAVERAEEIAASLEQS